MAADPEVRALLDRLEIGDLLSRFCDAVDHKRWGLLDDVFVPDAVAYFPSGTADQGLDELVVEGAANIAQFLQGAFQHIGPSHHMVSNLQVDIDGDGATYTSRIRSRHGNVQDPTVFEESLARFSGAAVRTPGGWRISQWREVMDFMLGSREAFAPRP